ncbi:MAG: NGG1p interacting factor NIF3 [Desulfamplus sp.]|nr:NGG1p interacting factor NIF3 [Desulfamplus sp.]
MYMISFYVPATALDSVKTAMFNSGAGKIGKYDNCCWQTQGHGQFRPLKGSSPFTGTKDKIEQVEEFKVEMVCEKENLKSVLNSLVCSHPYEEPAYHAIEVVTLKDLKS